jgi:exodeoxyribonuclease VII large subunit
LRAATPSVAAELIVPDKTELRQKIDDLADFLQRGLERLLADQYQDLDYAGQRLDELLQRVLARAKESCRYLADRLEDLNPLQILKRGFALVEKDGRPMISVKKVQKNDIITLQMHDGRADAEVREIYDF